MVEEILVVVTAAEGIKFGINKSSMNIQDFGSQRMVIMYR
jgi:hypothetical protein